MRHSGQWKRIFWLVQTIFYIFFQRLLPEKAFFLSSGNLVLKESFIPAIGERYFFLIKTITLLESFFYQRKPSLLFQFWKEWKSIFRHNLFLLVENDFLAIGNHFLPLSLIFFTESFIPVSGNAFFSPKEQYFLFRAFLPASENHYLNYTEAYLKPLLLLLATIFLNSLNNPVNGRNFPSNRNVFLIEFSIPASGNRLSV